MCGCRWVDPIHGNHARNLLLYRSSINSEHNIDQSFRFQVQKCNLVSGVCRRLVARLGVVRFFNRCGRAPTGIAMAQPMMV
jgi:hypothetical protein